MNSEIILQSFAISLLSCPVMLGVLLFYESRKSWVEEKVFRSNFEEISPPFINEGYEVNICTHIVLRNGSKFKIKHSGFEPKDGHKTASSYERAVDYIRQETRKTKTKN